MRERMTRVRGKFFAFLLLTALLFGICAFGACYEGIPYEREECDYQTITSADQLFKMKETGAYRLAADIDLRGKNWTPKAVAAFDGGGKRDKYFALRDDELRSLRTWNKKRWLKSGCDDLLAQARAIVAAERRSYAARGVPLKYLD